MADPPSDPFLSQANADDAKGFQTVVSGGTAYIGDIHLHGGGEAAIVPPPLPDPTDYLAALCQHYQRWQRLYTLTEVTGKLPLADQTDSQMAPWESPFEFALMVQTVQSQERDDRDATLSDRAESIERLPVLEGLRQYAKGHVLLVGRPGAGKSTALAKLVLEEARQGQRWPVLVELRSWSGSIEALIGQTVQRHGWRLSEGPWPALWQSDRLLLLFDGVNELPAEAARSQLYQFRRNHPQIPMIFTTRDLSLGGDLGIEKKLEMQPLSATQMQAFVRAYLALEQAAAMWRQLGGDAAGPQSRLRELGQTPLLLWMLCDLFRHTGAIPDNLGLVFRLFTQGYETRLKQDVVVESDRGWWQAVLQQLAWEMMQSPDPDRPVELRVTIARSEAVKTIARYLEGKVPHAEDFARKCVRDLQKYHLLQAGAGYQELEFRHQLLQEYYAAEALLERLPEWDDRTLQQQYLNYLKWTEPVALMLALLEDERQALRVVRSALQVDLFLGARLAGDVRPAFQEQAIGCLMECIRERGVSQRGAIELLGWTGAEAVIPHLQIFLQDQDFFFRWNAAYALGEIGSEGAIDPLIQILQDQDADVRMSAAKALGKIGSERVIDPLIQTLQDQDADVRGKAASALGEIGSEGAIDSLIQILQDQDANVRKRVASALGRIGSERAIDSLICALQDQDADVRGRAASALGKIGGERVLDPLIRTLQDQNPSVCERAASALGRIGSERAIGSLILALKERDSSVRGRAAYALGMIGSERAINPLILALQDQDSHVRENAADALGMIGSERAIEPLILALQDQDSNVRWSACYALGTIGDERAIDPLILVLQNQNSDIRASVSYALGEIGSKRAINPLTLALQDQDAYVRQSAAEALGKIGSEGVIDPLILALEDQRDDVCRKVAEVLGKIGSAKPIDRLWQLWIEGSGQYLRKSIVSIQTCCKYYNYELYQSQNPIASNQLRLQQEHDRLQNEWNTLNVKLTKLRRARAIEVGAAVQFQLDQQIDETEAQLTQLNQRLIELEQALSPTDADTMA